MKLPGTGLSSGSDKQRSWLGVGLRRSMNRQTERRAVLLSSLPAGRAGLRTASRMGRLAPGAPVHALTSRSGLVLSGLRARSRRTGGIRTAEN